MAYSLDQPIPRTGATRDSLYHEHKQALQQTLQKLDLTLVRLYKTLFISQSSLFDKFIELQRTIRHSTLPVSDSALFQELTINVEKNNSCDLQTSDLPEQPPSLFTANPYRVTNSSDFRVLEAEGQDRVVRHNNTQEVDCIAGVPTDLEYTRFICDGQEVPEMAYKCNYRSD